MKNSILLRSRRKSESFESTLPPSLSIESNTPQKITKPFDDYEVDQVTVINIARSIIAELVEQKIFPTAYEALHSIDHETLSYLIKQRYFSELKKSFRWIPHSEIDLKSIFQTKK